MYQLNQHEPTNSAPHSAARPPEYVYVPQGPGTLRELWQWLSEDWQAHDRDWTRPGFRAVAWHRFGNFRMRLKPFVVRAPFSVMYRAGFRFIRNVYGIELPYSVKLGRKVVFDVRSGALQEVAG